MRTITKQEGLDVTFQRYVIEKVPFGHDGEVCIYGTPGNPGAPRCAIGQFLPDERPMLTYKGDVISLFDGFIDPRFREILTTRFEDFGDGHGFWRELQRCHDNAASIAFSKSPAPQNVVDDWRGDDEGDSLDDIRGTYLARTLRDLATRFDLLPPDPAPVSRPTILTS